MQEFLGGETARLHRRLFSRIGWALAAMLVLQLAVQLLLLFGIGEFRPHWMEHQLVWYAAAVIASYGVAFPAAILILRGLPADTRDCSRQKLTGRKGLELWFMGLGWMYLSNILTLAVISLLETLLGEPMSNPLTQMSEQPFILNLLLGCVLAPLAEELLFRKTLMDRLRPWGEGFALVASALLFSLSHANFYQMLYAFTVGVILGGVYLKTGQVKYTMALHAGLNLVSIAVMPVLEPLGDAGNWVLSALVLSAMVWAIQWTFRRRSVLWDRIRETSWGNGEIWGHFMVNPGMTAFVLSVIVTVAAASFS